MNYYDRYDELEEIVNTLDTLIDNIEDKEYKEDLSEIKFKAEDELKEISNKIYEIEQAEEREQEREYNSIRI